MQAIDLLSKRISSWRALDAVAIGGAAVLVAALTWSRLSSRRSRAARPPGPKGYPLIGNLFDLPKEKEWLTYADWGKKYGNPDFAVLSVTNLIRNMFWLSFLRSYILC